MKVICYPTSAKHQQEAMLTFAHGLARYGIADVESRSPNNPGDCDLAVFWGHRNHRLIDHQKRRGAHYLVMERGYIGDRFLWTSLGFDGLNGRARFPTIDDGFHRWRKYFSQYLKPWKQARSDLCLIMGQCRGDESLRGVDFESWVYRTARRLKENTNYRIAFRPHPGDPNFPVVGIPILYGTLESALEQAEIVITYNSNSGVDAIMAGVPASAADQGSMIYEVAQEFLKQNSVEIDRSQWLKKMAYTQWLPYEIENGDAWAALRTAM